MVDFKRAIIRYSVEDVIRILENEPVKADMVPEITVAQVMNRVSIAHLSIERALKFLITEAGGSYPPTHDLRDRYRELLGYDPVSAKTLEGVFGAAVSHYRYNPNTMTHLKSLERYLEVAGSGQVFQDIRYWELTQSLDEIPLRRVYLSIHIELLHGLSEILLGSDRPMKTVEHRVEQAVQNAMWPTASLAYESGTPKELSVHSYQKWRQGFSTWSVALADAVQNGFTIGDDFLVEIVRSAYRTLLEAADPAVRYFASTLGVLPNQPRDIIPCVEWLGPEKELYGSVKTPAGTHLGFIIRGDDRLWSITPTRDGQPSVSAKARSQTDARCHLALLLTRPARATVQGKAQSLRIVGEEWNLFQQNYNNTNRRHEGTWDEKTWTHKMTLWDKDHGINIKDSVRVEVPSRETEGVIQIVQGTVTKVAEHEVYLSGSHIFDRKPKDPN